VDVTATPPHGIFDVAVLRFFIQVLGKRAARQALENIGKALRSGGQLIIVGNSGKQSPVAATYRRPKPRMLIIYDEGQAFTESEYRNWLTAAGFLDIHVQFGVAPSGASFMPARKA
jgi:O-methyltransferase domain